MKPNKRLAATVAAALAVGGVAVLSISANPAQASSDSFALRSGINDQGTQAGSSAEGTKTVSMTVTPATALTGAPINVQVSSPDYAISNGPVAQSAAGAVELAAVISLNGNDYLLRGPSPTVPAPKAQVTINPGWTISSNPGGSSGATTNAGCTSAGTCGLGALTNIPASSAVATSTGLGAALITNSTSPVFSYMGGVGSTTIGAAAALTAPASVGSFPIELKTLVQNTVSGGGALDSGFDAFVNLNSADPAQAYFTSDTSSYLTFSTPVSVTTVAGPSAAISTVTGQAINTVARSTNTINVTGSNWGTVTNVQLCTTLGASCDAALTGLSVSAGALSGGVVVPGGATQGARALKIQGTDLASGAAQSLLPITILGTQAINLTIAGNPVSGGGVPATVTVNGTNWDPTDVVTIQGQKIGPASTVDGAVVAPAANSSGAFTATYNITDGTTTNLLATGTTGTASAAYLAATTQCVAYIGNYGTTSSSTITNPDPTPGNPNGCYTEQDVLAQVTAGTLRQDLSVASASINPNAATIDLGSTPVLTTSTTLVGKMNQVTVTDTRGSIYSWGLTGVLMTPFNRIVPASPAASIPAANATVSNRTCTIIVGSAGGCPSFTFLGASSLAAPAILGAKDGTVGTTGSTSGQYQINARINLSVPAYTGIGQYKSVLRVTLS